jgi:hypothetical protein
LDAVKEQNKRNKEHQSQNKDKVIFSKDAEVNSKVTATVPPISRFSGMANSDADRALRLAAVEARMGIVRCTQCRNIVNGPCLDEFGFQYCSIECNSRHRKTLPE